MNVELNRKELMLILNVFENSDFDCQKISKLLRMSDDDVFDLHLDLRVKINEILENDLATNNNPNSL